MSNIRVHLDLAADLPVTAADPYQLQQVFLNLVNNAVDAILEQSKDGDLWVRTGTNGDRIFIESQTVVPACRMLPGIRSLLHDKPVGKERGWD